jgi:hypothetical protein
MLQQLATWQGFLMFPHFSRLSFSTMTEINNATRNDKLSIICIVRVYKVSWQVSTIVSLQWASIRWSMSAHSHTIDDNDDDDDDTREFDTLVLIVLVLAGRSRWNYFQCFMILNVFVVCCFA